MLLEAGAKMKEVYSTKELSEVFKTSERNCLYRAKREGWEAKPRAGRGGGNEWLVNSMPEATQQAIRASLLSEFACPVPQTHKQEALASLAKGLSGLMRLPCKAQTRAQAKAFVVAAFTKWQMLCGGNLGDARISFTVKYACGEIEIPTWVKEILPLFHPNTLANWQKALQSKGIDALGGVYGKHRKGKGIIDSNPDMRQFIIGQIAKFWSVSAASIHSDVEMLFAGQALPSLRALQRWVESFKAESENALMQHQNPDVYKNKRMPAFGNASQGIARVNQLWEFDSSPTDIMLEGGRYTLIGMIDVATRRVILQLAKTSNSDGVCALLRRAILEFGIPEVIKTDNGADYASHQVTTAIHALGIMQNFCTPFSPEQKPHIERFFGTFSRRLPKVKGFIGHSVAMRKAIEGQKSFAERIAKKKGLAKQVEILMTPEEFQKYCDEWCANDYGEAVHGAIKMSPNDAAVKLEGGNLRIQDERSLDILLSPVPKNNGIRTVQKDGIGVSNSKFYAPILGGMVGTQVRVTRDINEASYLYVYSLDGVFICRAEDPELTGVSLREMGIAAKACAKSIKVANSKEIQRAVRALKNRDIAAEAMAVKSKVAAEKREARPTPVSVNVYTTPALIEAGIAARVDDTPEVRQFTPLQEAYADRLASNKVVPEPLDENARRKANLCALVILERDIEAGKPIGDEHRVWLERYRTTSQYRNFKRICAAQGGRLPDDIVELLEAMNG